MTDAERLMRPFGPLYERAPAWMAPERMPQNVPVFQDVVVNFKRRSTNFYAYPHEKEIDVAYSAMLSLWATCKAVLLIANAATSAVSGGATTLASGPRTVYFEAQKYLTAARSLISNEAASFPSDLDQPDPTSCDPDTVRVNNLFLGASAWVLLHEIGHIKLKHQGVLTASQLQQQEFEADSFATEWLLADPSISAPHRQFRIFAIIAAHIWGGQFDAVYRANNTHPHASERMWATSAQFIQDVNRTNPQGPGIELGSYAIKAILAPSTPINLSDTAAEAFEEVVRSYNSEPR